MKNYQKELYDFLIIEDNFTRLQQMRTFYDDVVKPTLIKDFWDAVDKEINLKKKNYEYLDNWKTWYIYKDQDGLYLYSNKWIVDTKNDTVPFVFKYENLDGQVEYCIELYIQEFDYWPLDKLKLKVESEVDNIIGKTKNKSYLCRGFMDTDHFQSKETLAEILPGNRDAKVAQYADWIIELAIKYGPYLDEFFDKYFRSK